MPATTQPTTTQPTTTQPATTTPPAPGVLVVSATDIDLGATTTAATVRLSNDGASSIRWTLAPDGVAPLVVSATGSELAPGASIDLVITIDRGALAEGTLDRVLQLDSTGLGDGEVTVRALVEHPPTVTVARSVPSISCPWSTAPTVAAIVDDETTVDSVELSWNGPGRAGRATMAEAAPGQWRGSLNIRPINGTWSLVITATDARGNIGTATGTVVVSGC